MTGCLIDWNVLLYIVQDYIIYKWF